MDNLTVRFELFVEDMARSVDFYKRVLGFSEQSGSEEYQPLKRGSVTIGISPISGLSHDHYFQPEITSKRKGIGLEIVLEVEDVRAEYARVQTLEYPINQPLMEQAWGLTDFRLVDPDGYYIRISSRSK